MFYMHIAFRILVQPIIDIECTKQYYVCERSMVRFILRKTSLVFYEISLFFLMPVSMHFYHTLQLKYAIMLNIYIWEGVNFLAKSIYYICPCKRSFHHPIGNSIRMVTDVPLCYSNLRIPGNAELAYWCADETVTSMYNNLFFMTWFCFLLFYVKAK